MVRCHHTKTNSYPVEVIMLNNYPYPTLIAHRGAGKDAPENTIAAFRLGAINGYTMFECDVKLSKDGILFLLHDDTLDRTTNCTGFAKERTWAELSTCDAGAWHSSLYAGETLARFEALLNFIVSNQYQLDIEIKPNPGEAYETGKAVASFLASRYSMAQLLHTFMFSSFQPDALKGAKEILPEVPRALLLDDWNYGQEAVFNTLDSLECSGLITNYNIMDHDIVAKCHQSSRFVMVYTANDKPKIEALLSMGVDSVITDNMALNH